ncbi:uncharacterized mitochondrial protein AtMg00810-like [Malus sylvestris]|uniref:uncharacterized mitochondrial protein AtMg00810-like n=1 Tax=Malus sylvestris TaxID=3752 RepID=UPI0021ACD8CD|nr:uncharacterized mitochondrial protein AtMg00810-like [Malus sylvestris]
MVVNHEWPLFQMDVKNAFLHGDLEEEVYMKLPPGHPREGEPNKWCLRLAMLIYVDDIIITGDNVNEINALKCSLHQQFAIKDLGVLKYFLSIEMATSSKGLFLNQRKYVVDLLDEAHMLDCKPARTPLISKLQLDAKGEPLSNPSVYQCMVGKLIYLTITRPDIAYSLSLVSQFMHYPTLVHWEIVKIILRYLKGSVGRGILMKKNGSNHIMAYTDVDWAGNTLDRKSTKGFCTFVGGNLVA